MSKSPTPASECTRGQAVHDSDGVDLPDYDPEHDQYLDHHDEMGIGQDFSWFAPQAAPAVDILRMTVGELDTYGFATDRKWSRFCQMHYGHVPWSSPVFLVPRF